MPNEVTMETMAASDLRAEVARAGVKLYELAAHVGMHPATLGQVLRGRRPLSAELAQRVMDALAAGGVK